MVPWDFAAKSFTENFILDVSLDSGCTYADWSKLSNLFSDIMLPPK